MTRRATARVSARTREVREMIVATKTRIIGTHTAKTANSVRVRRMRGFGDDAKIEYEPSFGTSGGKLELQLPQPVAQRSGGRGVITCQRDAVEHTAGGVGVNHETPRIPRGLGISDAGKFRHLPWHFRGIDAGKRKKHRMWARFRRGRSFNFGWGASRKNKFTRRSKAWVFDRRRFWQWAQRRHIGRG